MLDERRFNALLEDLQDHETRIRDLENRTTMNEKDIESMQEDLKTIKSNTTWLLRIVIGAIAVAGINFVTQGGLTKTLASIANLWT